MQVGLSPSSLSGARQSAAVRTPTAAKAPSPGRQPAAAQDYPASPLIATQPQRYSVQLNDQLTAIQHADRYLAGLEQSLLSYHHSKQAGASNQAAQDIQQRLTRRQALSGGAVDRQLTAVLQGPAQVSFNCPALSQARESDGPEALLFSLRQGGAAKISALNVDEDCQGSQFQSAFSHALRRLGISSQGQGFVCAESQWDTIRSGLQAAGEGGRFPKETTALNPDAEPCLSERLIQSLDQGGQQAQVMARQVLVGVSQQRQQLAQQQEKARRLVEGMDHFPADTSAVQAAQTLAGSLSGAGNHFGLLNEAVKGQARFTSTTVRGLLY